MKRLNFKKKEFESHYLKTEMAPTTRYSNDEKLCVLTFELLSVMASKMNNYNDGDFLGDIRTALNNTNLNLTLKRGKKLGGDTVRVLPVNLTTEQNINNILNLPSDEEVSVFMVDVSDAVNPISDDEAESNENSESINNNSESNKNSESNNENSVFEKFSNLDLD